RRCTTAALHTLACWHLSTIVRRHLFSSLNLTSGHIFSIVRLCVGLTRMIHKPHRLLHQYPVATKPHKISFFVIGDILDVLNDIRCVPNQNSLTFLEVPLGKHTLSFNGGVPYFDISIHIYSFRGKSGGITTLARIAPRIFSEDSGINGKSEAAM